MRKLMMAGFVAALSMSLCLGFCSAADTHARRLSVERGSKVYLEPMNGFETFLSAAIRRKDLPVTVVSSPEMADYIVSGNADHAKAGWAKVIITHNTSSDDEASITVTNKKGEVVYAYAYNQRGTLRGSQSAAESCAKHLKRNIEGKE